MATAAQADQSVGGPTLISSDSGQPGNDRAATRSGRAANRGSEFQTLPTAAVESQEPASLPVNPFAKPASSTRGAKSDQGGPSTLSPLADSGRAADVALESESEGNGQPGGKQLEGLQSPQLTIQKVAPKEIQVGKPAVFRVTVRNVGQVPACEVEVRDLVPKGTRLLGTTPQATRGARSEIVWTLGTIRPGEESTVEMQLMPTAEGEIGSVATVHFGADASARSVATRPQLVVETHGARQGAHRRADDVERSRFPTPGTGVATGVVLEERIPPGLQHPAGTELEYEVGDLKPGESRKLDLPLVANRPGPTTNILSARGDGNLRAERKLDLEVVAPQLDVARGRAEDGATWSGRPRTRCR